ncbi:hypothetical protein F7725_020139 [Dissostichus mawsoni]|uniref:CxC3 like cysteine cluster domain-containing protein n=1 Tax=Dissostichus mawsoni TaxID=36200 RepID=A0A7J5YDP7_DISMA|nr:hypothetical protein F7725_020139 [Dissostichus mawsoni]
MSSWTQRQKEVQQCWQQARPQNVDNLLITKNIIKMTCNHCLLEEAVIRCEECMPSEWFCAECDILVHTKHTLHSRQTTCNGFYKCIPPTESVKLQDGKYIISKQDRLLPTSFPSRICSCEVFDVAVSVGRPIILAVMILMFQRKWGPEFSDFVRSGYWPATMQAQTLFHQDLFHSFEAMKTAAPGMSRQAFTAMLDQRTSSLEE